LNSFSIDGSRSEIKIFLVLNHRFLLAANFFIKHGETAMGHRPRGQPVRRAHRNGLTSGDLENALDLDRGIGRKGGDADGGSGMAALVAERCYHQVGGAIHHFGTVEEVRR